MMANSPHDPALFHHKNTSYMFPPSDLDEFSPAPRRYNCTVCSTSFRRREHFERHLRSHSKRKDFKCDLCDKRFARRDTLQRHSTLHEVPHKAQRTLPRAPHACFNCVKSKQRCSGSYPCDRCNKKGWPCQFTKGSKEVSPKEQEILPNTTERRTIHQECQISDHNSPPEPSLVCGLYPISTVQSDPGSSDNVNFTGWPCVDPPFPSQARELSQSTDAAPLLEPCSFWPLDDVFGYSDVASSGIPGLHAPFGVAETVDQQIKMSVENVASVELPNSQQKHSRRAEEVHKPSSNAQSENYVSQTTLTEEDRDILISEDYGHVPKPSISTYERISAHYAEVSRSSSEALPSLYSLDILHVCTQLYFEHFHQSFPILHQHTFEARSSSWLLYIAVAAVGSQYSRLSNRTRIFFDLVKAIRMSLLRKLSSVSSLQNNLELAQATLLFNFSLLFSGTRENLMHLQYQRNLLVTMCRPLLIPSVLFAKSSMLSNGSVATGIWTQWIATESWKRLVYFTWLIECFQLVLFDLPTLITVDDLHLGMPCKDELWQSASSYNWEMARASQRELTECLSVSSLLKTKIVDQHRIRSLSGSALWILVFAVYIAERHSTKQPTLYPYPSMHSFSETWNFSLAGGIDTGDLDKDNVDAILGNFQQAVLRHLQVSPLLFIVAKFSLILRLLRFIQYRHLYVSSGWMAQHQEVGAAAEHIAQLLQAEPRRARQSLLHAAQLFRLIRSQQQFDPYDSFILLMAVLYIWNYDRFVVSAKTKYSSGADAENILRIDQNMSEDLQEKWIAGTFEQHKQLHITGLGVLNGHDSVPRTFRESMRILSHGKAWSSQANAIKYALRQILLG
ncbi:Zn(II)2Cys6 transcription factor domain-containing protein, partial [Aspergillus saccharolyticus JOP 1030-1]